jgi:hypothetical protein
LTTPVLKSLLKIPLKMISCGFEHCLLLTGDEQVASWGCGASGCLGHDNYLSYSSPKLIENLKNITSIECGGYHNAALDSRGQIFTWGRSDVG